MASVVLNKTMEENNITIQIRTSSRAASASHISNSAADSSIVSATLPQPGQTYTYDYIIIGAKGVASVASN